MTTALKLLATALPWVGLALAAWGLAALTTPAHAAFASGVYILVDAAYSEALGVIERFAPPIPPRDRTPE